MDNMKHKDILIKTLVLVMIIVFFVVLNKRIDDINPHTIKRYSTSTNVVYDLESIDIGEKYILNGWLFDQKAIRNVERESKNSDIVSVLLVEQNSMNDSNESLFGEVAEMSYRVRDDVNSYFECDYDYSHCGFIAEFDKDAIDEDKVYRVFFKWDKNEFNAIDTNMFVYKNRIYYTNPLERTLINTNSLLINEIVNNGVLLANREDVGFYIYQYGSKLYWIADSNAYFSDDGKTYMQYQIDTTQYNKLPRSRLENGLYWSYIGGNFESYEIEECNIDGYRVMVRDIPSDYSVTYFEVGYHTDGKWVWHEIIRPCYAQLEDRFSKVRKQ